MPVFTEVVLVQHRPPVVTLECYSKPIKATPTAENFGGKRVERN